MATQRFSVLLLGLFLFGGLTVAAQETPDQGAVRLPWDEFRRLLELDKDEILLSWEDFQKILAQTGEGDIPPFQLKDEKVLLTREQFKRLLDRMKPLPPKDVPPPAEFLITKAAYTAVVSKSSIQIRSDLGIDIFGPTPDRYAKIPLFPMNLALKDVLLDGRPGVLILENNRHTLATRERGSHRVEAEYSLLVDLDRGPREVSFPVLLTPITSLQIDIPETKIDVEIPGAQSLTATEQGGSTRVTAHLSPCNTIQVKWKKKIPEVAKGPAKIYADTISHLILEDGAIRVSVDVNVSVLQNSISALSFIIPDGYSVLDVRGPGVGDWSERRQDRITGLDIPFDYPKQGNFSLTVTAEQVFSQDSLTLGFTGFAVQGALREKGYLGIELKGSSEVSLVTHEGLDPLDVSELPAALINRSQKPLLFGFKYLHPPFELIVDVKTHEQLPVIGTVIDSASGVSLFTEDGKLVHRIIYSIRNTSKQFLELMLPEGSQVWSVFVGEEPAKPRLSGTKILIPLNRSQWGATGLAAFDVELIYFQKSGSFSGIGRLESLFPVPDIIISQMLWSVYLPEGYVPLHFGGTVEPERLATGLRPLLAAKKRVVSPLEPEGTDLPGTEELREKDLAAMGEIRDQFSENLALSDEQLARQMKNEAWFGRRVQDLQQEPRPGSGGILPIRIQIPTSGRLFRFAKTIISEDPLTLRLTYIQGGLMSFLRILILAGFVVIIYAVRKKLQAVLLRIARKSTFEPLAGLIFLIGLLVWTLSRTVSGALMVAGLLGVLLLRLLRSRNL